MMSMKQAKDVVQNSFNRYCGFHCVLPADLLFCWAGNVRFNNWTDKELFEVFYIHFTK